MPRLTAAVLVMIISCGPVFVKTSTAAIDDDLQVVYTIDDAKWLLAHGTPFKAAPEKVWTAHDQNALAYAYKHNLNPEQLDHDFEYRMLISKSIDNRDRIIEKETDLLQVHNISRAKELEHKWVSAFKQGNPEHIAEANDPFLGEIAAHKKEWDLGVGVGVGVLFPISEYQPLIQTKVWNVHQCRQLEAQFPYLRNHLLARFKYFLWEKNHDLFYRDDDFQIAQIDTIDSVKNSLSDFVQKIGSSGIDNPQAYPEMAALHENDWNECRRILDKEMPAKYRKLSSTLEELKQQIFSQRIIGKEQDQKEHKYDVINLGSGDPMRVTY